MKLKSTVFCTASQNNKNITVFRKKFCPTSKSKSCHVGQNGLFFCLEEKACNLLEVH